MNSFYKKLLSKKVILFELLLAILVLAVTLYQREVSNDDSWFGEQSYWLAHDGVVKLKSLPLIFTWEDHFLVYHKLLIWIGGTIVYCFGWSINYFRLFNIICFFTTLWFVWKFSKDEERVQGSVKYLAIFLLLFTPLSISKAFEFRPEVPLMLFGFTSFLSIHYYLKKGKVKFLLLSGFLAGLSFLMHLNGAVFVVSGFLFLLVYKQYKGAAFYFSTCAPTAFIYFIPLLNPENLKQWYFVIKNWPQHSFAEPLKHSLIGAFLFKILGEHKRYFWGGTTIGISSLFFLSLILKGKYLLQKHKGVLIYTIILMVCLALLSSDKVPRYLMYLFPFMALIAAISFSEYKYSKNQYPKWLFVIILVAQIFFVFHRSWEIVSRRRPLTAHNRYISTFMPAGANVLAPWPFVYNEIGNYHIDNYDTYLYLGDFEGREIKQPEMFRKAYELNTEYIVVDEYTVKKYDYWFKDWKIEPEPYYEYIVDKKDLKILKRKSSQTN